MSDGKKIEWTDATRNPIRGRDRGARGDVAPLTELFRG